MFHDRQREERQRERVEERREANEIHRENNERRYDNFEHGRDYADRRLETGASPTFIPTRPTRILISPGNGAGWVTYAPRGASDAFLAWMLTYEPLIRALDRRAHKGKSRKPHAISASMLMIK